ncbi:MAG: hypothetical protein ACRD4Q_11430 [Candidatus Acidiferrales bacterium]
MELDPFANTEEVEEEEETLRLLDEDCREIDEGRVRMLTPEEARARFRQWLTSSPTTPKR